MKRFKKNKRGLSPIIADVLLLSIIVSLMTVVWGFAISYTQSYQTGQGASLLERILIEDVDCYTTTTPSNYPYSGNVINVTIYNYGQIAVQIHIVFLNSTPPASVNINHVSMATFISNGQSIAIGAHATITIYLSSNWDEYSTQDIKLVTARGYTVEGVYAAPNG